jgi:hypothetical protein
MKKIQVLVFSIFIAGILASCATFATNREVPLPTIPVLNIVAPSKLPRGTEIASYTKVIGICIDYDAFVEAVAGKDYDVVEKAYVMWLFHTVSAIAK